MNFDVARLDSVDSTNTEALKRARSGADEGFCVIAKHQTAGRGRQGRHWASAKDAGMYLSIILRPKIETRLLPLISLAAAIAAHDTLNEIGLQPDIKWPNDILINEKKICGILAETTETSKGLAVVVGIGINVAKQGDTSAPSVSATNIESELGRAVSLSDLETLFLDQFGRWYARLHEHNGPGSIIDAWARRSTYARGKAVRATLSNEVITGITDGIEIDGSLRIGLEGGSIRSVNAGDVERIRPDE